MDSHDKTLSGGAGGIAGFFNSLLGKARKTVRKAATKKTVAKKPAAKKTAAKKPAGKKTSAKKSAPKKK